MNISATKIKLAKKILSTNDENVINYISTIFSAQNKNWWKELPDEIKSSVNRGLKQVQPGQTTPHKQVMKKYSKWLKK